MTSSKTARRILRRQGMPPEEIRAVLGGERPEVMKRLLELHRERLAEQLDEQQEQVARIERALSARVVGFARVGNMGDIARRTRRSGGVPWARLRGTSRYRTASFHSAGTGCGVSSPMPKLPASSH